MSAFTSEIVAVPLEDLFFCLNAPRGAPGASQLYFHELQRHHR